MNSTIQELMRKATQLTKAGRLDEATNVIRRTLGGLSKNPRHAQAQSRAANAANSEGTANAPKPPSASSQQAANTRSGELQAPIKPPRMHADAILEADVIAEHQPSRATAEAPPDAAEPKPRPPAAEAATPAQRQAGEISPSTKRAWAKDSGDTFSSGSFTHTVLTRHYKLYTPPVVTGAASPLVVMLHGCTQNADDFAAGTAMNEMAREQGFYVLYPEQSQDANPSRCWNWFNHNHQQRDRGEPALLAEMTLKMIRSHNIDPARVYIAGLSAGAAMAVIVAAAYPEMFAAVGVHSGLARGAASNVLEALKVMKNGIAGASLPINGNRVGFTSAAAAARTQMLVPAIVFHGDKDQTVHPRNGEQVLAAALLGVIDEYASGSTSAEKTDAGNSGHRQVHQGVSAQGRRYTRSVHHDANGNAIAEHWVLHGAGHAWSGGRATGSYTDAKGPDASSEMLRFFFQQRKS